MFRPGVLLLFANRKACCAESTHAALFRIGFDIYIRNFLSLLRRMQVVIFHACLREYQEPGNKLLGNLCITLYCKS